MHFGARYVLKTSTHTNTHKHYRHEKVWEVGCVAVLRPSGSAWSDPVRFRVYMSSDWSVLLRLLFTVSARLFVRTPTRRMWGIEKAEWDWVCLFYMEPFRMSVGVFLQKWCNNCTLIETRCGLLLDNAVMFAVLSSWVNVSVLPRVKHEPHTHLIVKG